MKREALFTVKGMDCAECATRIEKRLRSLHGIWSASVNFGTERLRIEYDPGLIDLTQVQGSVRALGHEVFVFGTEAAEPVRWWQRPKHILLGLCGIVAFAGFALELAHVPDTLVKAAYGLAMLLGGYYPARSGWQALKSFSPNIHTLLAFAAAGAVTLGLWEEAAVLVFIFSLGEVLEAYAVDKARGSIRALMALAPKKARVKRDGQEVSLPVEELRVGDVIIIRPGEKIPMDGRVTVGLSAVDQAPVTGESIPVTREKGDEVFAGTLNQRGSLEVEVTKPATDTTISRIIHAVEEAQAKKTSYQRFGERFGRVYTPVMFLLAILVAAIPPLLTAQPFQPWFYKGLVVLVVSCSCGLVLSVPVSVIAAITQAARKGILIKGGAYLEAAAGVDVVAVDKTGTLTLGRPEVTDILPTGGRTSREILALAAVIESRSEHPLADAISRKAEDEGLNVLAVTEFETFPGKGACAVVDGKAYRIGGRKMFQRPDLLAGESESALARLEEGGKTVIFLMEENDLLGTIAVADRLRPEVREVVEAIRAAGDRKIIMLTGDNEGTAKAIAREAGIDEYRAGLLPSEKVEAVRCLKERGAKVIMVGDGVNDAPALAEADVGIAMGVAGTDVALETADVALMADDLARIPVFLRLSRRSVNNIKQNIVASLAIVVFLVPAALFGWVGLVDGLLLNEGAALLVIANGLRLLR